MPKDLRSLLDDCRREIPDEVVHVTKEVDPAHYDVTAIIKHLGASKKFPILIFDNPMNNPAASYGVSEGRCFPFAEPVLEARSGPKDSA